VLIILNLLQVKRFLDIANKSYCNAGPFIIMESKVMTGYKSIIVISSSYFAAKRFFAEYYRQLGHCNSDRILSEIVV